MERECDKYPALEHNGCGPDNHEKFIAEYLEAQGSQVERLCKACLPEGEKLPDFRITTMKQEIVLCEVKALTVSTGAKTKSDWEYENAQEYKQLRTLAKRLKVRIITTLEERKRITGRMPYPAEGRNTESEEKEYLKEVRERLNCSAIATKRLRIDIHRHDPFIWTREEKDEFINYLVKNLEFIASEQVPRGWSKNLENFAGEYRKNRDDGRFICNYVNVRYSRSQLSVRLHTYLGINWKAVERECGDAQDKIRDRLQRELEPDEIARFVIMLLTEDLVFMYSMLNDLKEEINRRVFNKFPKLSAIAFCEIPDTSKNCAPILHYGNFTVFYTPNKSIQPLLSEIFDKSAVHFR